MRILIIGCGQVGTALGKRLIQDGHDVLGVRRSEPDLRSIPLVALPVPEPAAWRAIEDEGFGPGTIDVVVLSANPGLRRGRDNRLVETTEALSERYGDARLIYTGSSSVYGDVDGAEVDEQGPVDASGTGAGLLAIEEAVARHPGACSLRIGAIVGPQRRFAARRIEQAAQEGAGTVTVRGQLQRPLSHIHEADLITVLSAVVGGGLAAGLWNVVAPHRLLVGDYYRGLAHQLGVAVVPESDGRHMASRQVVAPGLWNAGLIENWRPWNATD